jgi:hypothetical protein
MLVLILIRIPNMHDSNIFYIKQKKTASFHNFSGLDTYGDIREVGGLAKEQEPRDPAMPRP